MQKAAARTGALTQAHAAVAPQKRRRAFVTTKKGVCYLTVKIGREHFHLMRIYNYTIDAQDRVTGIFVQKYTLSRKPQ